MAIIVEGDLKVPFSIATTPRCRGGRSTFPWIAPLYPWYVPYIAECWARRCQVPFLKSLVWRDLGLNPGLPVHWRTLYPLGQWAGRTRRESKSVLSQEESWRWQGPDEEMTIVHFWKKKNIRWRKNIAIYYCVLTLLQKVFENRKLYFWVDKGTAKSLSNSSRGWGLASFEI